MANNSSVNLDINNNADGFDIAGGTTKRKLTVTGQDVTLTGSGSNTYTMPAASDTIVGRASTDTLTNKTINTASNTITIVEADISDLGAYITDVVSDTTPQLGGSLDVNGQKIVSVSNGNIDIEPNGTGNVLIGNFTFDADQTVGAGQDNYVLTYDNGTGLISLEAAAGGGNTYFNDLYIDQSGGTSDTYGALSGAINGANTTFTVSQGAYLSGSLVVYLNGQLQTQGSSEDYAETTPASGTFDFATAPASGDEITVKYQVQSLSSNTVVVKESNFKVKSITVESPTASEDLTLFFTDDAITVTQMNAVLANGSSTPSVTWTIRHGSDRSAAGNEVVTSGTTTTSISTGSEVTSFNDATIPAGSWVWLETTAQSGTVPELSVTIEYTVD